MHVESRTCLFRLTSLETVVGSFRISCPIVLKVSPRSKPNWISLRSERVRLVRVENNQLWSVGQGVKTPPFHGGNTGSNPVRTMVCCGWNTDEKKIKKVSKSVDKRK